MADQTGAIYLWGFPPTTALPDWLHGRQAAAADLPVQGTIVVYEPQAADFIKVVASADGVALREQHAILYVTGTGEALPDAWLYFADVVEPGDWPALRALLSCPHQAEAAQLARTVPITAISAALDLLAHAPLEPGALAGSPLLANSSPELAEHISTCESCRRELAVALSAEQSWADQLFCPAVAALAAYVHGETHDPAIAAHIATCANCSAEIATLRRLEADWAPAPAEPQLVTWLNMDLGAALLAPLTGAVDVIRSFFETLRQPPLALLSTNAQFQPTFLGSESDSDPAQIFTVADSRLFFSSDDSNGNYEFEASWDPAANNIKIQDVRDENGDPFSWFRIVISAADQEIWQGESTAAVVGERMVQQVVIPTAQFTAPAARAGINLRIEVRATAAPDGGAA